MSDTCENYWFRLDRESWQEHGGRRLDYHTRIDCGRPATTGIYYFFIDRVIDVCEDCRPRIAMQNELEEMRKSGALAALFKDEDDDGPLDN